MTDHLHLNGFVLSEIKLRFATLPSQTLPGFDVCSSCIVNCLETTICDGIHLNRCRSHKCAADHSQILRSD